MRSTIVIGAVVQLWALNAYADIVISTLGNTPNGFEGAGPAIDPGRVLFTSGGQSLTAPTGAVTLDQFSLRVRHVDFIPPGSPHGQEAHALVRGAVMAFAGNTAVGDAPLFLSDPMEVAVNGFAAQTLTFDTGGLAVTAGTQYVLFISIVGTDQGQSLFRLQMPLVANAVGGNSGFDDRAAWSDARSFADLSGDIWGNFALDFRADTMFEARFNVPSPATAGLVLLAVTLAPRRR
jgi:hypothetical protein